MYGPTDPDAPLRGDELATRFDVLTALLGEARSLWGPRPFTGLPVPWEREQPALAGLADQRTALWPHYDNSTAMYAFLSRVNAIRRSYGLGPGGSDMMTEAMVVGDPSQHSLLFVRRMHPVD